MGNIVTDTVQSDDYVDKAGSGAPNFSQGVKVGGGSTITGANKYQMITLAQDVSAGAVDLSATTGNGLFIFNNLTIGKIYKVTLQCYIELTGTSATENASAYIRHDGARIAQYSHRNDGQSDTSAGGGACVALITATATTVTFELAGSFTGTLEGDGTAIFTHATIEEKNNLAVTTDFL